MSGVAVRKGEFIGYSSAAVNIFVNKIFHSHAAKYYIQMRIFAQNMPVLAVRATLYCILCNNITVQ